MASLVTDNNPNNNNGEPLDAIEREANRIQLADSLQTIKGLKPEHFFIWRPARDRSINGAQWVRKHGDAPLAHWGKGTRRTTNHYWLQTCDGVVQRVGYYNDEQIRSMYHHSRRQGFNQFDEVRKIGTHQHIVIRRVKCPRRRGYIGRWGGVSSIPQGWGVFLISEAVGFGDPQKVNLFYCQSCIRDQMRYNPRHYPENENIITEEPHMLGVIDINPNTEGRRMSMPLRAWRWEHRVARLVPGGRRTPRYQEQNPTQFGELIIGLTENATPLMIKDVIDNHNPSFPTNPDAHWQNLPIKFCVNNARCGHSFYRNKPPRWQITERGYLCQPCFERHKVDGRTAVDFTKDRRGPPKDGKDKLPILPLALGKKIRDFGRGGKRKRNRKKRTRRRKSRGKSRRKKRRKSRRKRKR